MGQRCLLTNETFLAGVGLPFDLDTGAASEVRTRSRIAWRAPLTWKSGAKHRDEEAAGDICGAREGRESG